MDFIHKWKENYVYFDMLKLFASISNLFSTSDIPFIDYRITENLFCKYYNAINDARLCTAYDARIDNIGIGIKTFTINNSASLEKIAEFNRLRPQLNQFKGLELACQIAQYRNRRIEFAKNTYNLNDSIYHIIGRKKGQLCIFNTPYDPIDINNISKVKENDKSLSFYDGDNFYTFLKSKSVLEKRFQEPEDEMILPVNFIEDPLSYLIDVLQQKGDNKNNLKDNGIVTQKTPISNILETTIQRKKGIDYVILPLYSTRTNNVPIKSGLNQWNAGGRERDINEVYIPIPKHIHKFYPHFFPQRDEIFELELPDKKILSAKVCQDGGKALMSNPNSDLGEWILRKALRKKEGEILTMQDLSAFGIDSVMIEKVKYNQSIKKRYRLSFADSFYERYSVFTL